jgi:DNA-binding MarR family transcriptional regulator
MTDIISSARKTRGRSSGGMSPRDGRLSHDDRARAKTVPDEAALLALVELMFFAYRDFTGEADAALAAYGLGRAHHRVLHFVNRRPGIRVADLLALLKITKQSLARVLRTLVEDGWIVQQPGPDDRRERLLTLTARGGALAAELARLQTGRIAAALGGGDSATVRAFLAALVAPAERGLVADIMDAVATDSPVKDTQAAVRRMPGRPKTEERA